jgi:hypothetical protein
MECKYAYIYHNKTTCRCLQEASDCNGILEKCTYPLCRQSYEADLKDEIERKIKTILLLAYGLCW